MASRGLLYSRQDFINFLGHLEDLLDLYIQDDREDDADIIRNIIAEIEEFIDPEEGEPGTQSFQAQGRLHQLSQWYNTVMAGSKAVSATKMKPTGSGHFGVMPRPNVICP